MKYRNILWNLFTISSLLSTEYTTQDPSGCLEVQSSRPSIYYVFFLYIHTYEKVYFLNLAQ